MNKQRDELNVGIGTSQPKANATQEMHYEHSEACTRHGNGVSRMQVCISEQQSHPVTLTNEMTNHNVGSQNESKVL
jgi:hypothetical protein